MSTPTSGSGIEVGADLVTVALAFQVVVIVGDANVVVPQNLSAAVNYECFTCITASVASQLVVTIQELPGLEGQIALAELWEEISAFAASIPTMPLADVIARMEEYKQEIIEILDAAPQVAPSPSVTPSASPSPTPDAAAPGAESTPTPEPTASPTVGSPAATPATTIAPAVTPSPSPTPTSTSSSSAEPTPTPSPS